MKDFLKKIWDRKYIVCYAIPFILMDIIIKTLFFKNRVFPIWLPSSWLFSLLFIAFFGIIIFTCRGIIRNIIYWILFVVFFVMMLTNGIYYYKTDYFFNFSLIKMTNEGSEYIWDTIINTPWLFYLESLAILIIAICVSFTLKKVGKIKIKYFLISIVVFVGLHIAIPIIVLNPNDNSHWQTKWNIYNNCTDANQSIELSGLYEYSFRNFYVSLLKGKEELTNEQSAKLRHYYEKTEKNNHNKYTGIFKNKNIIFLQLEGMDSWLLNKKDTPYLYKLKQKSIDFKNHFSMYTGGGSTFNSELAANTGFVQPLSTNDFACWYYTHTYKNTMAQIFKQKRYRVDSFHMNSPDIYFRGLNYKNWGYDNYYGLKDRVKNKKICYGLDRELILQSGYSKKMFLKDKKFVDYIITYTPHMPFNLSSEVFKILTKEKYGSKKKNLSEEDFVRMAASETDYMVKLLMEELKKNKLYNDTVIVAYADHYLYELNDKSILKKYKETDNGLINHTPFFIWSSNIEEKKVDKVTMQANVLPTVLNLFGIDYDKNYYVGEDALDDKYEGIAFFPDYSWYDGNVYVKDKHVMNKGKISKEELNRKEKKVNSMIEKNDLTMKYDYFGTLKTNK